MPLSGPSRVWSVGGWVGGFDALALACIGFKKDRGREWVGGWVGGWGYLRKSGGWRTGAWEEEEDEEEEEEEGGAVCVWAWS